MSMDNDEIDIQQELKNINNVINVTRANIDALNAKFADFPVPPEIYLSEYEDLTLKLHKLEAEERRLKEQLNGVDSSDEHSEHSLQYESTHNDMVCNPYRLLRAYLPYQQRTSVQVRNGLTLRDALAKAMKLRQLTCETCCAYLDDSNVPVNWDIDVSELLCDVVTVRVIDKLPVLTSIIHNFVRKTFFSLVFCECCRKLLFQGFCCRTCGYKFHEKCFKKVPLVCHQVSYLLYLYGLGRNAHLMLQIISISYYFVFLLF